MARIGQRKSTVFLAFEILVIEDLICQMSEDQKVKKSYVRTREL